MEWGVCDRTANNLTLAKARHSIALAAIRNVINFIPSLDTTMNPMQGAAVNRCNWIHG
jgi:hypothetical protein